MAVHIGDRVRIKSMQVFENHPEIVISPGIEDACYYEPRGSLLKNARFRISLVNIKKLQNRYFTWNSPYSSMVVDGISVDWWMLDETGSGKFHKRLN